MQELDTIRSGRSISGPAVQSMFAAAAEPISSYLSSLLGPWGTYKYTSDSEYGDPIITQDCVRALRPLELDHPISRLLYGVASDQRQTVGDGAVTATVLCAELVQRCATLAEDGTLHPRAVQRALDIAESITTDVVAAETRPLGAGAGGDPNGDRYRGLVRTQVSSKFLDRRNRFTAIVEEATDALARDARRTTEGLAVDVSDRITIVARRGRSRADTRLFDGVLIKKGVLNTNRTRVEDATVAVIDQKLYIETETAEDERSFGASVSSPDQLAELRDAEDRVHYRLTRPLLEADVDAVISRKGIDERISNTLQDEGILVVRRAKPEEILNNVAAATGATVVGDVTALSEAELGDAGIVEERTIGELEYTVVGECPNAAAVSVLTQAGTWLGAEDVQQSLEVVFDGMAAGLREDACVPGGGALEMRVAARLRDRATSETGRHALALEAIADAFEDVVGTLAHNCGLDRVDTLAELRAAPANATRGVVVTDGDRTVGDVTAAGIFDPASAKRSALVAAIDGAGHAVTVDEVRFEEPAD